MAAIERADRLFPVGARVHHANQLWTYGWTEAERRENPQWGWGTVLEVEDLYYKRSHRTGDIEVKVRYDAPLAEGSPSEGWWPAWLIDTVERRNDKRPSTSGRTAS